MRGSEPVYLGRAGAPRGCTAMVGQGLLHRQPPAYLGRGGAPRGCTAMVGQGLLRCQPPAYLGRAGAPRGCIAMVGQGLLRRQPLSCAPQQRGRSGKGLQARRERGGQGREGCMGMEAGVLRKQVGGMWS